MEDNTNIVTVEPVETNKDLKQFIYLPSQIYKGDSIWVPPMWSSEYKEYRDKKNAVLAHSHYQLYLAFMNGKAVGRIIVYIDFNFNNFYKTQTGFFGAFESIDNPVAGESLLQKAESWLSSKGMTSVRGPIDPVAEKWGFVIDGYEQDQILRIWRIRLQETVAEIAGEGEIHPSFSGWKLVERDQ